MWQTLMGFTRKELSQALHDPRMRGMLFAMPVLQLLLFGFALSSEVRNIRLAVVSRPDDAYSRRLAERFDASGWFKRVSPGEGDPFDWVRSGRAEAVLIAPARGGDADAGRGSAVYQFLIDATNAERARGVEQYARAVLAEHLRAEAGGAAPAAPPFQFSVRTLYNPEEDTATFLVPGTLCLLLGLTALTFTGMSMAREREMGTLETLLSAPLAPVEIMLGKTVPFVILGMIQLPIVLFVSWLMGVPMRAPLWEIAACAFVFVCSAVSIGFLISSFMKNQQQSMLGTFLILFPMIQLSGVIYPVENMPDALRWITRIDPMRYFVVLIRHLMLKGGDMGAILPNLAALAAIGAGAWFWAAHRFRQTLN
ncbi:MAG: ABC transporter permease [Elusimicrobia bacterium]|nr:ABC transporter permease [Elusimicrobiota bacterium]